MAVRVVIAAAVRTAIGTFGGDFREVPARRLAAACIREVVRRAHVDPAEVDEVILGCVNQVAEDAYIARAAALEAGLPRHVTAYAVNRLCASGVQAVWNAAGTIALGQARIAVAGGVENMSRLPFYLRSARWGRRLGHDRIEDGVLTALTDPLGGFTMGETAERLAERYGISRQEQDAFAAASHAKAVRALEAGYFDGQIVPITVTEKSGSRAVTRDSQPRPDTSRERLAALRPVFKEGGTVTAGNASSLNDGAAALVLMSEEEAARRGVRPLARFVGARAAGVEPEMMGIGPVPATQALLDRLGLGWEAIDLIELNEAFAAQALAVLSHWPAPVRERVNVNGGAIALGHPLGATGAILLTKLVHELQRRGGRYGLVTLCVGGGQGLSALIERL